eukprot:gene20923-24868_t
MPRAAADALGRKLLARVGLAGKEDLVGEVLATIRSLAEENRTMVIVTHEMSFARDVANRVIFFDKGVIVEQGEAKALFANPKEERTRQFLSNVFGETPFIHWVKVTLKHALAAPSHLLTPTNQASYLTPRGLDPFWFFIKSFLSDYVACPRLMRLFMKRISTQALLTAPTLPQAHREGINALAATNLQVDIAPYCGMDEGDLIELFWNNCFAASRRITAGKIG